MKKTLFFIPLFFLFLSHTVTAQTVNIPDANFKQALLNQDMFGQPPIDTNGDGEIQVSEAEAQQDLIVGDPWISYNIQDMTGIGAFVNIHYLSCINNQLTTLDLSQNLLLEEIDCRDNQLASLNLGANTALTKLQCQNNFLSSLDISQNTGLEELRCQDNNLTSLDVNQNTILEILFCSNNSLNNLDVRNGNNQNMTGFNATNNPNLTCIFVDDKIYSQNNWNNGKDSLSHFVETQQECDALGVGNFNIQKIKLYPNPVKNKLMIEVPANNFRNVKADIFNLTGKRIMSFALNKPTVTLQLSTLEPGMYFLQINIQHQHFTKKIIKL